MKKKEPSRESHSGFSYYSIYQHCSRKFFLRYLVGLQMEFTSLPLLNGSAFHEGKAVWYETGSMDKALRKVKSELKSRRREFRIDEEYEMLQNRTSILLQQWIMEWGELDLKTYKVIEVEQMFEAPLPNGFIFTIKPDALLQRRDNSKAYIHETKTSGFSAISAMEGVLAGDQATSYIWALGKKYPKLKIEGVIPDISYWNKKSVDPFKIRNERGTLVKRSPEQLEEFEIGTMNVLSEISQKAKAVRDGIHPIAAFPRCTHWCNSFFSHCEYYDICRTDFDYDSVPKGFKRDPWAEEHQILNYPEIKGEINARKFGKKTKQPVPVQAAGRPDTRPVPRTNRFRRSLFTLGLPSNKLLQQGMVSTSNPHRLRLNRLLRSGVLRGFSPLRRQRYLLAIEDELCREEISSRGTIRNNPKRSIKRGKGR